MGLRAIAIVAFGLAVSGFLLIKEMTSQPIAASAAYVNEIASPQTQLAAPVVSASKNADPTDLVAAHKKYTRFAPSLEGTTVDGELEADAEGNLVLSLRVKDLFDYFLSAVGQSSFEQAIAMIELYADDHLPPHAANQAKQLLKAYLAYREAAFELMEQPVALGAETSSSQYADVLEGGLTQLVQLRRKYLGETVADAFFRDEESYAQFTVSSLRVYDDQALSEQARAEKIELLRQQLPEALRQHDEEEQKQATARDVLQQAVAANLSDEELRDVLAPYYSKEAIEAVVTDQRQEQEFKYRFDTYLEEKGNIITSGLSEIDQQLSLDALKNRIFGEGEFLKVATYESIERVNTAAHHARAR